MKPSAPVRSSPVNRTKPKLAPVIDLMEALKKSIAERGAPAAPTLVEADKKKPPKSAPAADAKPTRRRKTG